jgi:quercetin dioxygenase-like cupin family protein
VMTTVDIMNEGMVKMEGAEKEDLKARAMHAQELISYQPGAVVSRTILDKKAGTITVFSFDEGEGLSEHTAPFDATVLILDGEAEITIDGDPIRARAGEMVIMPADRPHALRAITQFKMMLIMIRA